MVFQGYQKKVRQLAVRGPVGRWARGRMGADSCPSVQERSTRRCLGAARGTWLRFQRSEAISTFSGVPKRFCFSVLKRWFCQRSGATHLPDWITNKVIIYAYDAEYARLVWTSRMYVSLRRNYQDSTKKFREDLASMTQTLRPVKAFPLLSSRAWSKVY